MGKALGVGCSPIFVHVLSQNLKKRLYKCACLATGPGAAPGNKNIRADGMAGCR